MKIIKILMAGGILIAMNGCSSVEDIVNDVIDDNNPTGTAKYIDSAVSGVNYKCDYSMGITNKEGEFTFVKGKDCTFYLGTTVLKTIPANKLENNGIIYEDNIYIAQILQAIDENHNLEDGIELDQKLIIAIETGLKTLGIDKLPTTEAEAVELIQILENEGITIPTLDEVCKHMKKANPSATCNI